MGQNREDGASDARRDESLTLEGRIARDAAALDPVWMERFESDVAKDMAFEDSLLIKAWCLALTVWFLVLMQRLFS